MTEQSIKSISQQCEHRFSNERLGALEELQLPPNFVRDRIKLLERRTSSPSLPSAGRETSTALTLTTDSNRASDSGPSVLQRCHSLVSGSISNAAGVGLSPPPKQSPNKRIANNKMLLPDVAQVESKWTETLTQTDREESLGQKVADQLQDDGISSGNNSSADQVQQLEMVADVCNGNHSTENQSDLPSETTVDNEEDNGYLTMESKPNETDSISPISETIMLPPLLTEYRQRQQRENKDELTVEHFEQFFANEPLRTSAPLNVSANAVVTSRPPLPPSATKRNVQSPLVATSDEGANEVNDVAAEDNVADNVADDDDEGEGVDEQSSPTQTKDVIASHPFISHQYAQHVYRGQSSHHRINQSNHPHHHHLQQHHHQSIHSQEEIIPSDELPLSSSRSGLGNSVQHQFSCNDTHARSSHLQHSAVAAAPSAYQQDPHHYHHHSHHHLHQHQQQQLMASSMINRINNVVILGAHSMICSESLDANPAYESFDDIRPSLQVAAAATTTTTPTGHDEDGEQQEESVAIHSECQSKSVADETSPKSQCPVKPLPVIAESPPAKSQQQKHRNQPETNKSPSQMKQKSPATSPPSSSGLLPETSNQEKLLSSQPAERVSTPTTATAIAAASATTPTPRSANFAPYYYSDLLPADVEDQQQQQHQIVDDQPPLPVLSSRLNNVRQPIGSGLHRGDVGRRVNQLNPQTSPEESNVESHLAGLSEGEAALNGSETIETTLSELIHTTPPTSNNELNSFPHKQTATQAVQTTPTLSNKSLPNIDQQQQPMNNPTDCVASNVLIDEDPVYENVERLHLDPQKFAENVQQQRHHPSSPPPQPSAPHVQQHQSTSSASAATSAVDLRPEADSYDNFLSKEMLRRASQSYLINTSGVQSKSNLNDLSCNEFQTPRKSVQNRSSTDGGHMSSPTIVSNGYDNFEESRVLIDEDYLLVGEQVDSKLKLRLQNENSFTSSNEKVLHSPSKWINEQNKLYNFSPNKHINNKNINSVKCNNLLKANNVDVLYENTMETLQRAQLALDSRQLSISSSSSTSSSFIRHQPQQQQQQHHHPHHPPQQQQESPNLSSSSLSLHYPNHILQHQRQSPPFNQFQSTSSTEQLLKLQQLSKSYHNYQNIYQNTSG